MKKKEAGTTAGKKRSSRNLFKVPAAFLLDLGFSVGASLWYALIAGITWSMTGVYLIMAYSVTYKVR